MLRETQRFYDKKLESADAALLTEILIDSQMGLVDSQMSKQLASEIREAIDRGDLDHARLKLSDWLTENQPAG